MALGVLIICMVAFGATANADPPRRPNVLLILADDLRPELGCYGNTIIHTPNIDRLAAGGVAFTRAYCQIAVCNPSRSSLLTGLRPDATGVFDNFAHFRRNVPEVVTLPQHFKDHGYRTQAVGKVFHATFFRALNGAGIDDAPSWSEPSWWPSPRAYFTAEGERVARGVLAGHGVHTEGLCLHFRKGPPPAQPVATDDWAEHFIAGPVFEAPDVDDSRLYDGQVAERAIRALNESKGGPFFLAVGFFRPHLPFVAPKKYWDLYDPATLPLAKVTAPPPGAPAFALPEGTEPQAYEGTPPQGPIDPALARRLIHGYYASISHMDAQVGRVLDELDRLRLRENTVVVLIGDHGWHLGEQGHWGKSTNSEVGTRVPLIVSAPGMNSHGQASPALAELVDLYPTLCELAGLSRPEHLQGKSLAPLLDRPERAWKDAAFSQYPRPGGIMGRSIRTDRYRLTLWVKGDDFDHPQAAELYDHEQDPAETVNLAPDPGHAETVTRLTERLQEGWRRTEE